MISNIRYQLSIKPNFLTYASHETKLTISLQLEESTSTIVLDSNKATTTITSVCLSTPKGEEKTVQFTPIGEDNKLKLEFGEEISGAIKIIVCFKGVITDNMRGFYVSKTSVPPELRKTCVEKAFPLAYERVLTTQFEATDARAAFPCFDKPACKAVLELIIMLPKILAEELTVLSNYPESARSGEDLVSVTFQESVCMSTYLFAWAIGSFQYVRRTTTMGVPVRAFAVAGQSEQLHLAAVTATRVLSDFEKFFGLPYPLPKLDLLAVPDFSAGAMENWGLITFRESCFFVSEASSKAHIWSVIFIITHELAHMWFGNLVTMKFWDDLWLNEGFATFIMYTQAARTFVNEDMISSMLASRSGGAYADDTLITCQPIRQHISDENLIRQMFDPIRYAKGGTILRMLACYLGYEKLGKGLSVYLNKFKMGNADSDDLMAVLADFHSKETADIIRCFIDLPGVPLISVSLSGDKKQLLICQDRLAATKKENASLWTLPIFLETGSVKSSDSHKEKILMKEQAIQLSIEFTSDFFLSLNYDESGYYVTKYSKTLEEQFLHVVKNSLDAVSDRTALKFVRDKIALFKLSQIEILGCQVVYWTHFFKAFANREDPFLLDEILGFMHFLEKFDKTIAYNVSKAFVDEFSKCHNTEDLISCLKNDVSFPYASYAVVDTLFENYNQKEQKLEKQRELAKTFRNLLVFVNKAPIDEVVDPTKLPSLSCEYKQFLYTELIRNRNNSNLLITRLKELSCGQEEQVIILCALGHLSDKEKIKQAWDFVLESNIVKPQNKYLLICSLFLRSHERSFVLELFEKDFATLSVLYYEGFLASRIVRNMGVFHNLSIGDRVKKLFRKNPNVSQSLEKSLEEIQNNNFLFEKYFKV